MQVGDMSFHSRFEFGTWLHEEGCFRCDRLQLRAASLRRFEGKFEALVVFEKRRREFFSFYHPLGSWG